VRTVKVLTSLNTRKVVTVRNVQLSEVGRNIQERWVQLTQTYTVAGFNTFGSPGTVNGEKNFDFIVCRVSRPCSKLHSY
jgi:hypothetical protein